jgi:hypothetical protein
VAVGADAGSAPRVRLIDLATGRFPLDFEAFDHAFRGGVRVARGDVNGDNTPDLIVAAGPGGGPHVKVFDGATGQQLPGFIGSFFAYAPAFTGGVFAASADVNGDGFADVVTGAGAGGGPHVRVFSGADGSVLTEFMAYGLNFFGGVTVAAGDVTGDGFADLVTGAGPGGGPHVRVFTGPNAVPFRSYFPFALSFRGGVFVAAGDVNGDGAADVIVGIGPAGGPQVRVYDGATGLTMANFFAFPSSAGTSLFSGNTLFSSGVRVAAVDADGDGVADIVAMPGPGIAAVGRTFNSTRTLLGSFLAFDPAFLGGAFVG